jgi:DNA-binding IclR family transcriptional regulator
VAEAVLPRGATGTKATAGAQSTKAVGATVPAAARAMKMFEIFAREKRELTKSEVAKLLGLPESSTSDLLNTLHSIGYLTRTATTRRFYPTGRLWSMANEIAGNDPLLSFGAEACGVLSEKTGETAVFAVRVGASIKIQAVAQGSHRLRYVVGVGDSFSIHGTAVGKALLSSLADAEMDRLLRLNPLQKMTPNTRIEPRDMVRHVVESRERGWFSAQDEGTVGVSSFAVAGQVGLEPVGLGIVGPTDRIASEADRLVPTLLEVGTSVFDN